MNPSALLRHCENNLERWLSLLQTLVDVDSGSRDLEGVAAVIDTLEARWRSLGFTTERTNTKTGPQLVSRRLSPQPDAPTLLLIGHVDTVFERGTAALRPFELKDGRAYGPGVADMKGGLVAMLAVVEALKAQDKLDLANFVVLNNCDEEIGSPCSRAIVEALCPESDAALIFEPGRADGSIVTERKGGQTYSLKVKGKAAHAGVNPQLGASAILALSKKVVALHELNDYNRGLTLNVGLVQGGTRLNIVADQATAEIDVRTPTQALAEAVKAAIERIAAHEDVPGTGAQLDCLSERAPLVPTPQTQPLIQVYRETASELGLTWGCSGTGGGSDGNFTAAQGVPTLDALGPVGGLYHSAEEYLDVASLPLRVALSALAITRFAPALKHTQ